MTEAMPSSKQVRTPILVAGGVVLVVLLAALVIPRLLAGGGDGDDLGAPPETAGPGSTTTTTAEAPELGSLPESFSTKNPFTPLADTTPATAATDEVPAGTDTGTGTEPTDVPADTTGGTAATEPDRESARFSLVEVYAGADGAPVASVQVDGSSYTVGEGETFAGYTAVSLSQASGSGTFTDPQGGTFTARTGESQLK